MTDKKLRVQFPYQPSGTNYSDYIYKPDPSWEFNGSSDVPTVQQIKPCNDSSMTRKMIDIVDGSESFMSSNQAYAGWSVTNDNRIWRWDSSYTPTFSTTTNPLAMCIGHKGPASTASSVQSWQKGVLGIAMEHKDTPYSGKYGHYIQNAVLLYRKPSDSSAFYTVTLFAGDGVKQALIKGSYANQTPFKTSNPRRDGSQGGLYMAMEMNHPAVSTIVNDNYVFQGLYMLWGSYDGNSQFQGQLQMWNFRLIFDTSRISDDGSRVVMPINWQFQGAYNGWDHKLTN